MLSEVLDHDVKLGSFREFLLIDISWEHASVHLKQGFELVALFAVLKVVSIKLVQTATARTAIAQEQGLGDIVNKVNDRCLLAIDRELLVT